MQQLSVSESVRLLREKIELAESLGCGGTALPISPNPPHDGDTASKAEKEAPARSEIAESKTQAELTDGNDSADRRVLVNRFIDRVFEEKNRRIRRTDIWRVAGYTDATQFERFQRNKRATAGSIAKFTNILKLIPADFLGRLDKPKN